MRQFALDVRHAARLFARRPGVSALVVTTLGIGIAATTIAFSLADAILWHPLPFPHADRLVRVRASMPAGTSGAVLEAWPAAKQVVDGLYPFALDSGIISVGGEPQAVTIGLLSPGLLGAIGVNPIWGRDFGTPDAQPGSGAIIVSAELWRRIGDNSAVTAATEHTVLLEGVRQTVVGVMPDGFGFPVSRVAVWRPYVQGAAVRRITALGRLKPGVTLEVAQALARATTTYQANPVSVVSDVQVTPFVVVNGMTSAALRVGLAAAALLLLIAVANAANVLLADAVRRDSEMAIRVSLGASWSRLARQMLTETLLMTAVAAVTAVVVSAWSVGALVKAVPYLMSFQALRPIALDWRALSFAAIIATFASIGASWLSLVRATRVDAQTALRGQRSGTLRQARSRNALTVAQIAVTLPLLASAGLLANGLVHLSRVDPGFDPNHLVDVEVQMPTWRYSDDSQAQAALERVRTEASRLPGVVSATISNAIPPSLDNRPVSDLEIADTPLPPSAGIVSFGRVDAAFFSTLRIPIIAGRGFDAQDRPGSQPVAVVSHALADLLAPNGDALRRRFRESKSDPWLTIVGVAGNITTSGVEQSSTRLTFYTPRAQTPAWWYEGLIVRTRPASEKVVPELRALFRRVMPDAPIIGVTTAAEALDNSTARVRFTTDVITAFAGVAFALALVGVYGAFWCAVRQRTREMGVRLALGAAPADVLRLVIGLGARLTLLGLTAGLPIALIATRLLRSLLFGVSSTDPAMLTAVVCLLAMAAMAATWLPARHASRIDPVSVLRAE